VPWQVRKPRRKAVTELSVRSSDSSCATTAAALNAAYHPQLHWPELGYLLDKLASAAAASGLRSKRRDQQHQQQAATGLLRLGTQVTSVMDWQDAVAAEQHQQEVLMVDDGDAVGVQGDGEQ